MSIHTIAVIFILLTLGASVGNAYARHGQRRTDNWNGPRALWGAAWWMFLLALAGLFRGGV